jgi:outer membrane protein assembly factor BamB
MLRRLLKAAAATVAILVVAGAVLYLFGLRVVLDGGGGIHFRFVESQEARDERIAQHRSAQRAGPPVSPVPAAPAPVAPAPSGSAAAAEAPTAAPAAVETGHWPDFRGPKRDGHYTERAIRTDWPAAGLTPLWKQPIGGGYASFVAARGRAFTIEQRGAEEIVAAYDILTGRELWTSGWTAKFSESLGGPGPRATPTWSDGRVYALGAAGELRVLDDTDGRTVWRTNILEDAGAANIQWGMSAAPLIVDDTVVVLPGGANGRSVVAYDRRSGKPAWSALNDTASYSSPMLVELAGVRQMLVFSASRVVGLTPGSGQVLWEHPWKTQPEVNASQPLVVGDNRLFLSTGYGMGATMLELTKAGDGLSVREVWRNIRMKNQFTSSVLHDGFIYGLDESILACVDAATGDLKWKGGRYGYGQIMLASGHLVVLTEDGRLGLVRATPERHHEIAIFPVLEGKTWNHPAIAGGYLLIRNINEMAAFDLRAK